MASYNTITVSANSTRTIDVGPGETFENTLIDITADGASCRISAYGDGWTVRNVGVKGTQDSPPKKLFVPSVPAGGSATVEHVFLGDGTARTDGNRQGGVWVNANAPHEGDLLFHECYIGNWADNGLYGSGPAYQVGSRAGSVRIEQSYAINNNIAGFRIGGDGSYVKDSTIVSDSRVSPVPAGRNSRGIWSKDYGSHVVENCDFVMTGPDATHCVYTSHGASTTIRDCRVTGDAGFTGDVTTTNISRGDADPAAPAGVPLSAEEAASGTSSAGGSSGTGDPDPAGTLFEWWAGPDTSNVAYEFTVDGDVQKKTSGEPQAEDNDAIARADDGTVTVSGVSGNGHGDGYYVLGTVTDVAYNPDEYRLVWDGAEVTRDDLPFGADAPAPEPDPDPQMRTLRFTTPEESPHSQFHYAFECDGIADTHNVEATDSISMLDDGTVRVEGTMVPGKYTDQYTVEGAIYSLLVPPAMTLEAGGTVVDDPQSLVDGSRDDGGDATGPDDNGRWSGLVTLSGADDTVVHLPHELGTAPASVNIEPASPAASTDYWLQETTADAVIIRYAQPRKQGDALDYLLTVWA